MRKSRKALVAALALGTVLSTGSIAGAQTGSADNISTIEAGIGPNSQRADRAGRATLFSQVQTFDGDGGPFEVVNKAAERVTIDFDDDIQVLPGASANRFDRCGGQGGNDLDSSTTAQAVTACSDAVVGSGQAVALIPTGGTPPFVPLELTVTTINGPLTVPGPPCTPPADGVGGPEGCEYVGGEPQIILHAYNQAIAFITTVGGEVRPSSNGTAALDYGESLVVNDAPDTAGDLGSLILFNSTVGAVLSENVTIGTGKRKRKIKKLFPYVTASCEDDGANGGLEYDFQGNWVYDDGTTDTDTFKQKCGNPAP